MLNFGYQIFLWVIGVTTLLPAVLIFLAFFWFRNNYTLKARSPLLTLLVGAYSLIFFALNISDEAHFNMNQSVNCLTTIIISHLYIPLTAIPLLLRALKLLIVFTPKLRHKYIYLIKEKPTLIILTAGLLLFGGLGSFVNIHLRSEEINSFLNDNNSTNLVCSVYFYEFYYFLPLLFAVSFALLLMLYHLKGVDDAFNLSYEIKLTAIAWLSWIVIFLPIIIILKDLANQWVRLNWLIIAVQITIYTISTAKPVISLIKQHFKAKNLHTKMTVIKHSSKDSHHKENNSEINKNSTQHTKNYSENNLERQAKSLHRTESVQTSHNHIAGNPTGTSDSLRAILADPGSLELFSAHAIRHLSVENVYFYVDVTKFMAHSGWNNLRSGGSEQNSKVLFELAYNIHENYIKNNATYEVNISSHIRLGIRAIFSGGSGNLAEWNSLSLENKQNLFVAAREAVYLLMKTNLLQSFLHSAQFLQYSQAGNDSRKKAQHGDSRNQRDVGVFSSNNGTNSTQTSPVIHNNYISPTPTAQRSLLTPTSATYGENLAPYQHNSSNNQHNLQATQPLLATLSKPHLINITSEDSDLIKPLHPFTSRDSNEHSSNDLVSNNKNSHYITINVPASNQNNNLTESPSSAMNSNNRLTATTTPNHYHQQNNANHARRQSLTVNANIITVSPIISFSAPRPSQLQ
jgi:biopolymer transport protein ExbB/TolQ